MVRQCSLATGAPPRAGSAQKSWADLTGLVNAGVRAARTCVRPSAAVEKVQGLGEDRLLQSFVAKGEAPWHRVSAASTLRRSRTRRCWRSSTAVAGRARQAREPGHPRACACGVLRQHLAGRVPPGRGRSQHQGPCRAYLSGSVLGEFGGHQRSMKSAKAGLSEDDDRELLDVEAPPATATGRRQRRPMPRLSPGTCQPMTPCGTVTRACLRAGVGGDRRLRGHHHGPATLAADPQHRAPPWCRRAPTHPWRPGFATSEALERSMASPGDWANRKTAPPSSAA